SPVQHVFNKSLIWGQATPDGPQVVELVISAAEREVRLGVERVAAELLPELAKLLPRVRRTPLLAKRLLGPGTATCRRPPRRGARGPADTHDTAGRPQRRLRRRLRGDGLSLDDGVRGPRRAGRRAGGPCGRLTDFRRSRCFGEAQAPPRAAPFPCFYLAPAAV